MSKRKSSKAIPAQVQGELKPSSPPSQFQDSTDSSFQNLRQKIEGRLQDLDKKSKQRSAQPTSPAKFSVSRGKKRSANGAVIESEKLNKPPPTERDTNEGSELKSLIQELGGTKEDLDLITGVVSDSELEGSDSQNDHSVQQEQRKGKSLEAGISNILKEIALAKGSSKNDENLSESDSDRNEAEKQPELHQTAVSNVTTPSTQKTTGKGRHADLICEPRPDWYSVPTVDFDLEQTQDGQVSAQSLEQLRRYAYSLLEADNEKFRRFQESSSSQAFYNTVIASGTLSDKMSALTLAVQESPLHNMKALENLVGLARKRSRAQAVDVLRAIKDLFAQGSLLPGDRRLYPFASQPGLLKSLAQGRSWKTGDKLPQGVNDRHLICWAYESWLKEQYFEILKILEVWCNDEIEFSKSRAVSYVYELLKEKPEQESNLLRLLINKLGDPVKKIASQASYLIMQLLIAHPAMKDVVISTLESDFIFRPGQSMHGKYYAVVTINQTALSLKEEGLASKLLAIYFSLFKSLLKPDEKAADVKEPKYASQSRKQRQRGKKTGPESGQLQGEELREKLISAILTGINRSYPYTGNGHQSFDEHIDTLFQITHAANFNTSIQAMMLIQQLTSATQTTSDRFYRTLYESLLDARLITSSKQQMYLNLLHRSLKSDLNLKRMKAFVKRILQILSLHEPSFICGTFFLLKDLEKTFPSLTSLLDQPEEKEDDEEVFHDVDDEAPYLTMPNQQTDPKLMKGYDAQKRAPEHANADSSCAWELVPFLAHFHPAVAVSADYSLEHSPLPGKPDLSLHTLIHFLDRFVYKNPKLSAVKARGSSIMQPMANEDTNAILFNSAKSGRALPVNSEEFKSKRDEDVAAQDVFFHKYFNTLGKSHAKKSQKKARSGDEAGSIGSDEEDEVWKAMIESAPDLEELDEDENLDPSDMSDFEAAMEEDDEASFDQAEGEDSEDDGEVDIEAGIFDDSDVSMSDGDVNSDAESEEKSEFGGLSSESDDDNEDTKPQTKNAMRNKEDRDRRKKLKALPVFASASDYAQMLDDDDDDEDMG